MTGFRECTKREKMRKETTDAALSEDANLEKGLTSNYPAFIGHLWSKKPVGENFSTGMIIIAMIIIIIIIIITI